MWRWIVVAVTVAGCEPLPGETRCSSTMIYGTAFTKCRTTPPEPPPEPDPPPRYQPGPPGDVGTARWWCTDLPGADAGYCSRTFDGCEHQRVNLTRENIALTGCDPRPMAVCFSIQTGGGVGESCHPTSAACRYSADFARDRAKDVAIAMDCHDVR